MSTSTSVMAFSGTLSASEAESMANKRIPHGTEAEVCRLFQSAGSVHDLLVEAGGKELPFTFLEEGSVKYGPVSDPTWSIDAELVGQLDRVTGSLDEAWAVKVMRPWGKSFIQEIRRAKKAGATAYANTDPVKLYEDSMRDVVLHFQKLRAYIQQAAERGMGLLVCRYEDL